MTPIFEKNIFLEREKNYLLENTHEGYRPWFGENQLLDIKLENTKIIINVQSIGTSCVKKPTIASRALGDTTLAFRFIRLRKLKV